MRRPRRRFGQARPEAPRRRRELLSRGALLLLSIAAIWFGVRCLRRTAHDELPAGVAILVFAFAFFLGLVALCPVSVIARVLGAPPQHRPGGHEGGEFLGALLESFLHW